MYSANKYNYFAVNVIGSWTLLELHPQSSGFAHV